jgi:hypothetical protein
VVGCCRHPVSVIFGWETSSNVRDQRQQIWDDPILEKTRTSSSLGLTLLAASPHCCHPSLSALPGSYRSSSAPRSRSSRRNRSSCRSSPAPGGRSSCRSSPAPPPPLPFMSRPPPGAPLPRSAPQGGAPSLPDRTRPSPRACWSARRQGGERCAVAARRV